MGTNVLSRNEAARERQSKSVVELPSSTPESVPAAPSTFAHHVPSLNLNVRGLGASATLAVNEQCARLRDEGRDIIRFGLGQSPFPVPHVVVEALKANAHQKDYLEVRGLKALREAVSDYYRRRYHVERRPEDVLIGPGSKELMFLIQLVYYGDLVIPAPSWVSYAPQATMVGRQIRWVQTEKRNRWSMEPQELEVLCAEDPERPRLLILNYPNNPSGCTYSVSKLKQLAEIARRYRVVMLSDEIYGEIQHDGKHRSIAEFYPEGTIISSGLSKWCGAGGWRLGTFTFPENLSWLRDAMTVAASETFTATAAPIQYAAVKAFQGSSEIETYLDRSRRVLSSLGNYTANRLQVMGLDVASPQGGFYLFPDFRPIKAALATQGITTSSQLTTRLLDETGVATLPGSSFGCAADELTLRLAYVDFDGAAALEAIQRLDPAQAVTSAHLKSFAPKVLTALDRMEQWISQFARD